MSPYPAVDESAERLKRAGWSVGEVATAAGWLVCGCNGENVIEARGSTQAEAWHRACEQAAAVGMLRSAPRHGEDRGCDRSFRL
jgi:hypothetical protein